MPFNPHIVQNFVQGSPQKCVPFLSLLRRNFHRGAVTNSALHLSHTVINPPDKGSGTNQPPFLITHGLLGSKSNWNSIAKAVAHAASRQVIVFDARNHGDSPKSPDHSYDLMVEDILQLAKTLGIERFSLLGHSMGGRTAMVLALQYPTVLDKVVVVDVSPVSLQSTFHSEMKEYLRTMMLINFNVGRTLLVSEARKIGNEALKTLVPQASVRAFLLTNLAEVDGTIVWKPNLPVLIKAVDSVGLFPGDLLTKKFESPTLFIRGEKSTYIPDEDIPEIKNMFPNAKIDTIKGSGHWPHADNVKDFLASLLGFLKS